MDSGHFSPSYKVKKLGIKHEKVKQSTLNPNQTLTNPDRVG